MPPTATTRPTPYRGAEPCDLVPDWDADGTLLALCRTAHAADPDDLLPQEVLADYLDGEGDPRGRWVRAGCDLWRAAGTLTPGEQAKAWDYEKAKAALGVVTGTAPGGGDWRTSGGVWSRGTARRATGRGRWVARG